MTSYQTKVNLSEGNIRHSGGYVAVAVVEEDIGIYRVKDLPAYETRRGTPRPHLNCTLEGECLHLPEESWFGDFVKDLPMTVATVSSQSSHEPDELLSDNVMRSACDFFVDSDNSVVESSADESSSSVLTPNLLSYDRQGKMDHSQTQSKTDGADVIIPTTAITPVPEPGECKFNIGGVSTPDSKDCHEAAMTDLAFSKNSKSCSSFQSSTIIIVDDISETESDVPLMPSCGEGSLRRTRRTAEEQEGVFQCFAVLMWILAIWKECLSKTLLSVWSTKPFDKDMTAGDSFFWP